MRIHVIRAPNLPAAMRLAQAEHGEDAVILDTNEGPDGATVRVGVEADMAGPIAPPSITENEVATVEIDEPPASPPDHQDDGEAAASPRFGGPDPLDTIAEALSWHGVPHLATRNLLMATEAANAATPEAALAAALARCCRFARTESLAGPVALIGPPGGGKSATVIKLAAMRVLAGADVRLINADMATTGSRERIGAFADALGLTPVESSNTAETAAAVSTAPHDAFTIVDTTGRAPADADDLEEAAAEIAAVGSATLVLPAAMAPAEAAELAETFSAAGARSLIVTGLDMSRRIGALIAAADAADLEIIGVGVGRKIGDGLKTVTAETLARLILAPPQPIAAIRRPPPKHRYQQLAPAQTPPRRPHGAAA